MLFTIAGVFKLWGAPPQGKKCINILDDVGVNYQEILIWKWTNPLSGSIYINLSYITIAISMLLNSIHKWVYSSKEMCCFLLNKCLLCCMVGLVSASDVWCMVFLSGNISEVSKSSSDWLNYTGFPEDVCIAFFNVSPRCRGAKPPHERRNPSCLQLWRRALISFN